MRIAYLDCFSGISGDMFLAALLDAGVPSSVFEETVAALNLGAGLGISRVTRSGISATKLDVIVQGKKDQPRESASQTQHQHSHHHPPEHYSPEHSSPEKSVRRGHLHDPENPGHRGLTEILKIIETSDGISKAAMHRASEMFNALGAAEAKIHNIDIEKVHFHEVGAVDAIVDVTCAAVGVEALAVDEIICSPLNVGSGTVTCAHGIFPVPAPATLELLKGVPIYSSGVQAELVTPTGAVIAKTFASRFCEMPAMKIETSGYGAGMRDFDGHPNVLRIIIGEVETDLSSETPQETITVLEANIDDLSPQVVGYAMERLLEEGALDTFCAPVQMKKSRPGMLLTVLCRQEDAAKLSNLIFAETSTLGIRRRDEKRQVLRRRWESISTQWGSVRIKIANMNGTVANYAPEFEDCRRIAQEHNVPLKDVMQEALQSYGVFRKMR